MNHQLSFETKDRILGAARHQFAHFGFNKVTMHEIAEDVGLGKASLYYYFPTKEDLFRAVVTSEHEAFLRRIDRILADKLAASEKLLRYVDERFKYMNELLGLNILQIRPNDKVTPLLRATFQEFGVRETGVLRKILQEGKDRKEFRIGSPQKVAETFLHTLQGLRLHYLRSVRGPLASVRDYKPLRPEMKLITDLVVRGLKK